MPTTLIIGGTGDIGSHTARKLVEAGERVVCLDLIPNPARSRLNELGDKVKILQGDISRIEDIIDAINENKVEKIINLPGTRGHHNGK